jgi:recombination protein RecA
VVKNKMAPPFREVEFDIIYGEGVSREGELIDLAIAANIVEKSGAWLSYNGERIGQGRENAKVFLREHADVYEAIESRVLSQHDIRRPGVSASETKPEGKADDNTATKEEGGAGGKASAAESTRGPNGSGSSGKPAARRASASA